MEEFKMKENRLVKVIKMGSEELAIDEDNLLLDNEGNPTTHMLANPPETTGIEPGRPLPEEVLASMRYIQVGTRVFVIKTDAEKGLAAEVLDKCHVRYPHPVKSVETMSWEQYKQQKDSSSEEIPAYVKRVEPRPAGSAEHKRPDLDDRT
jgi:hypothetical protein